jgi:hypothetical protein
VFISLGATELIGGTECGVERHVELFKKAGIWTEDGSIRPKPGDIIVFNWDVSQQPNDGFADHIGMVERVEGDIIHTIEGNAGGEVRRRTYHVGEGCIRGYARPKYGVATQGAPQEAPEDPEADSDVNGEDLPMLSTGSTGEAVRRLQIDLDICGYHLDVDGDFGPLTRQAVVSFQASQGLEADGIVGPITWSALTQKSTCMRLAYEVLDGKWGNGDERRQRLTEAGYDYAGVQTEVNAILRDRK